MYILPPPLTLGAGPMVGPTCGAQLYNYIIISLFSLLECRGMAVEDPTAPHGLKLTIEDYPYANEGLLF